MIFAHAKFDNLDMMKKDFIDPDLLDLLATSDISAAIKDKFAAQLYLLQDAGVDTSELEALIFEIVTKLQRQDAIGGAGITASELKAFFDVALQQVRKDKGR